MSNTKELVSVIVPVYKVEKYLERCVNSILAQTYKDIEVVLVDDGSPDNCPKMCDELAKTDSRIKVVHKENGGLSSARIAGFKASEGEFVLFVDSDDYIENNMVEELVSAITENDASLAMCAYYTQYDDHKVENLLPVTDTLLSTREEVVEKYILPLIGNKKNGINLPGFIWIRLMRRELINESFFVPENKFFAEDIVFDLMYSDDIKKIAVVNKPLIHYCVNGQSLTNKYRKNKWQMLNNLCTFKKEFLSERSIEGAEERLRSACASSVFASVDNAVLSGSYKSYLAEVKPIVREARDIIKNADKNPSHGTVALTMFLLNLRAYFAVYHLRKSRLK